MRQSRVPPCFLRRDRHREAQPSQRLAAKFGTEPWHSEWGMARHLGHEAVGEMTLGMNRLCDQWVERSRVDAVAAPTGAGQ